MALGMKSLLGIGMALLMALMVATVALPVSQADAAKLTACVNKKTGAMKMVFGKKAKKKCPKGYTKVTWNSQGPAGPNLSVYDSAGNRVGRFLGIDVASAELPVYQVAREGGIYSYFGSGTMLPTGFAGGAALPITFKENTCTGDAYLVAGGSPPAQWYLDFLGKALSGMNRIVTRTVEISGFGVPEAWVGNETYEEISGAGISLYGIDGSGNCVEEDSGFTGILFGLDSVDVPTPYDFDGPLEVR